MKKTVYAIIVIILIFSCNREEVGSPETVVENKIFKSLNHDVSRIDFQNTLTEADSLNYFTYGYMYMGGGVSAGDINNDGLIDLFFTGNQVSNKLYLNKGNLKFEDITEKSGVSGDNRWYTGVTMSDINHDGYLDIYCSVGGKFRPKANQLFINNRNGTFTEKAASFGIADTGNSVQSTFFDYDKDGDLDLYVANYPPTLFSAPNSYYALKKQSPKDNETDNLYRNDGDVFTNVTNIAGLRSFGLSLSATVADINNDGWPDLYVSNDFSTPDLFYLNNKNGTFSEHSKEMTKNTSFYGMGVDIADFNNDGLLDIFQVDMTAKDNRRSKANMASMNPDLFWSTVNSGFHYQYMQNSLQMNNGNINDSLPDFSNISRFAGISSTDWSWGPLFADLDNDGWKDLFISNGTRREINNRDFFIARKKEKNPMENILHKISTIPSERIDNFVLKNNHDLTFSQMNEDWGISFKGFSNGGVYVDLDNDGDLEIITNNIDDYASVFVNKSAETSNFTTFKFKGDEKNPFGIGVKVSIFNDTIRQYQELTLSRGFQSSVAPQLHFGLGKSTQIDSAKVIWPDGKMQTLLDLEVNQFLTLEYQNAKVSLTKTSRKAEKLFATVKDSTVLPNFKHLENYYDDYEKEILLPHNTSMLGPLLAKGDLNGDGLDDFIIGGAAGSKTEIFLQKDSQYLQKSLETFQIDSEYEDIGILIFDADNDGDNDIYIASGGNEYEPQSKMLQDRLYVNDGNGVFTKSQTALPFIRASASRVKSHDFDNDGDLDLFVGGRLVPGNYPTPAKSFILENQSSLSEPKFVDITSEVAPALKNLGMVTDALWTDFDNDGFTDLIVVGEWMPISVLRNKNGFFQDITSDLNLSDSTGWWFSINEGDFDKDGDIDYIVGNLGLNYKYKATKEETFDIYFNDFDGNNTKDIVLSYFDEGKKYPLRGRECSSQQMPAIKKKYESYASFSTATLTDVYTKEYLENSLHYSVKSFASVYLENQKGKFVLHKLPALAQISSINQILIDDFDGDNHLDAVIAGNLHNSEVETPRNDASNGLFLKGDSKGNFKPIKAIQSGLYIPGDVKDMAKVSIGSDTYIVVAKNSDYLQLIKIGDNNVE